MPWSMARRTSGGRRPPGSWRAHPAPYRPGQALVGRAAKPGPHAAVAYQWSTPSPVDRPGLPVDCPTHTGVVEAAEADQRTQQVAVEAVDHPRRRRSGRTGHSGRAETAIARLAVGQHVLAGALHALVGRVGPELVEERQLPDRAPVLGRVARSGLLPVALRLLGRQDRGDRLGGHRARGAGHDLRVVGRPVKEGLQRDVPDGRIARLEEPVERVGPKRARPAVHTGSG